MVENSMIELLGNVFPDWSVFSIAFIVFFVAEIIYVAFGFGVGLLCVGVLAIFMPVIQDVVVMILLVNLPVELYIVLSLGTLRHWHGLVRILIGMGAGILIGTGLLSFGPLFLLLGLLGIFLIVSGVGIALFPQIKPTSIPVWWEPLIGALSGILTSLFGTGGPPLIYYYQLKGSQKSAFRGNLISLFFLMSLIKIPAYYFTGLITAPRLLAAVLILPAVLLGAYVGNRIHVKIEEITFRRLVGIILTIIGAILLFRL